MKVSDTCSYAVQVLESVGVSRVHQEASAWSFQVAELLRYFYTEISLIKNIYMLSPPVFQIRVMITSLRYVVTSLTSPPPSSTNLPIHTLTLAKKSPTKLAFPKISALLHTCPGEKKSCLSLNCWIRKTSAKRPQVTSYVLVTFCDWHTLRATWIFCASSALSANLSSIFTQCHSQDEFQYFYLKHDITAYLLLRVQYGFNNKQQTQRIQTTLWHTELTVKRVFFDIIIQIR